MSFLYRGLVVAGAIGVGFSGSAWASGGNTATENTVRTIVQTVSSNVSSGVASSIRGGSVGALRAEDSFRQEIVGTDGHISSMSVWGNISYTNIDESPADQTTETDILTGLIGADAGFLGGDLLVGGSFAYTTTEATIQNNLTNGVFNVDQDYGTVTVTPYAAYNLTDNIFVSGGFGLSVTTLDHLTTQGTTTSSQFNQDIRTIFGFADATYVTVVDDYSFMLTAGLTRSVTTLDGYTDASSNAFVEERKATSTVLKFGGQVGYFINDFEPYAGAYMEQSLTDRVAGVDSNNNGVGGGGTTNDTNNGRLILGASYYGDNYVAGVETNYVIGFKDREEYGIAFDLRWDF